MPDIFDEGLASYDGKTFSIILDATRGRPHITLGDQAAMFSIDHEKAIQIALDILAVATVIGKPLTGKQCVGLEQIAEAHRVRAAN